MFFEKRRMSLALVLVLGIVVACGSFAAAATEMKYAGSWSNLSLYNNFEVPFWGETLPEALDGSVTFDVTSVDQLGLDGPEVFRLMDLSLYDIAATTVDYVVSDAPVLEGLDLPALAPDIETARKVVESFKPVLAQAFEQYYNAKLLAVVPYPAQVVFCKNRISGLADLAGKKVRASGRSTGDFLTALDAVAVNLAFTEVPQALQRGVVDCAITGSLSGYSAGWGEVSNYLYPLATGWDYVVTAMRLESWNQLSDEQQEVVELQIATNLEDPVWEAIGEETTDGVNCLTGAGPCDRGPVAGMTLVPVKEKDKALALQVLEDVVLPRWAPRVDQEWLDRWNATIGEVTGLTAQR